MIREFREFVMRGNVMDLAVGVIIGAAFGKIVSSLVNDILMPPLGLLLGGINFADLFVNLSGTPYATLEAAQAAGAATINYGLFINNIVDFLIIAFVIFLLVRQVNRLSKPKGAPEAPSTQVCPFCASGIPIKATRCPHCTSQLGDAPAPAA